MAVEKAAASVPRVQTVPRPLEGSVVREVWQMGIPRMPESAVKISGNHGCQYNWGTDQSNSLLWRLVRVGCKIFDVETGEQVTEVESYDDATGDVVRLKVNEDGHVFAENDEVVRIYENRRLLIYTAEGVLVNGGTVPLRSESTAG